MKRALSIAIICATGLLLSIGHAQDLLNNVFSPSVERGQIINIGGDKKAVGNNIFEGSKTIKLENQKACVIKKTIIQVSQTLCSQNNGTRNETKKYCINNGDFFASAKSQETCVKNGVWSSNMCKIHGRWVDASSEEGCTKQQAQRSSNTKLKGGEQDPILVRIAKLLLRITIALSVTFTLVNAIRYATSPEKEAQKKLLNIMRGIMIALGSLGIIYIVQSITTQTIIEVKKGDIRDLHEEGGNNYREDLRKRKEERERKEELNKARRERMEGERQKNVIKNKEKLIQEYMKKINLLHQARQKRQRENTEKQKTEDKEHKSCLAETQAMNREITERKEGLTGATLRQKDKNTINIYSKGILQLTGAIKTWKTNTSSTILDGKTGVLMKEISDYKKSIDAEYKKKVSREENNKKREDKTYKSCLAETQAMSDAIVEWKRSLTKTIEKESRTIGEYSQKITTIQEQKKQRTETMEKEKQEDEEKKQKCEKIIKSTINTIREKTSCKNTIRAIKQKEDNNKQKEISENKLIRDYEQRIKNIEERQEMRKSEEEARKKRAKQKATSCANYKERIKSDRVAREKTLKNDRTRANQAIESKAKQLIRDYEQRIKNIEERQEMRKSEEEARKKRMTGKLADCKQYKERIKQIARKRTSDHLKKTKQEEDRIKEYETEITKIKNEITSLINEKKEEKPPF